MDPDDPATDEWLQNQIIGVIDDLERATRNEIAGALNCSSPEVPIPMKTPMHSD